MKKFTWGKRALSYLLAFAMVFSIMPFSAQGLADGVGHASPAMEITEENLKANAFETYYYADGIQYTYGGKTVEFTSENQIQTGGQTYELKNKKTEVSIEKEETGAITISLSDLEAPVSQISGAWNSTFGGTIQVVYQTNIPGMEEVRSSNLNQPIRLDNVPDGTYLLTDGTIYEKANEWSPGYDFGNGVVTEAYFGTLPDIILTVDSENDTGAYLGVKTEAKVYDDFENDIWLQYQQKELEVGDTVNLRPWRVEQIVSNVISNDVQRPDFHFEIIAGDSVSLDTNKSNDKAVVTAVKPGTSVVKVTYEEKEYKGKTWGAISPVNIAYVVYTVGEEGAATITASENLTDWRHYDTIYYCEGETTPFTFTVDTVGAESVKVTVNGIEIQGNGNQYTADLENRSNIIGIEAIDGNGNIKSMYRVIDARFIEVNVANKTSPNQPLKAGDSANISFRGITMPVYKLASIYNPCMGSNATRVEYHNETLGDFNGKCSQWDLATNNDFDVTFESPGEYTFTSDNGIFCAWWGSVLGSDITAEGSGEPNLNAPVLEDYFSVLPDFTVKVEARYR